VSRSDQGDGKSYVKAGKPESRKAENKNHPTMVEMTSVLRRYSLIEPRIKYLTVITDCSGYTLNSGSISNPLMDYPSFAAAYTKTIDFFAASLVQDLGRAITVYDPTIPGSPHIALLRQVMLVNGPGVEGINPNIAYICTWADGGPDIEACVLARVG
jgi:hypothetical protein